jgi:hypothetical protein
MPFIDENKIAELYKEVDDLRNSSTYFQYFYLKSKKKIYKNLWIFLFLTLLVVITGWIYESSSEKVITPKVNNNTSIINLNKNSDINPAELNENSRIKSIYPLQIAATKNDPFFCFQKI